MSTYTPIATQTLGSAAASVTFSSIPQGYTDLYIVVNSYEPTNGASIAIQFNGDSGSNYSYTFMYGDGSSTGSQRATNTSSCYVGQINGGTIVLASINNYSNNTTYKTALSRGSASTQNTFTSISTWRNTSPITSMTISRGGNFTVGTTFSLYGIQVGNAAQKAQGGNIVVSSGGYMYHAFTSSGAFIPNEALSADILVVAGGGAGGYFYGNGGGAGGLQQFTSQSLTTTSYPVIVGAGGNPPPGATWGGSGSNSVFGSLTASVGGGGGGGGNGVSRAGLPGGSGGAAGGTQTASGGTGTAGQGYDGGSQNSNSSKAGGGGAGGVGQTGEGNGGIGATSALINTMGAATGTGELSGGNYYYAGGGGGYANGVGGLGGGGDGSGVSTGSPFTGGGGSEGSAGGSGLVIIRYAV
jgi:hypothetical protein